MVLWGIKGEIKEIETGGIKVVTEHGKKVFILKQKGNCFGKLKLQIGDRITAAVIPTEVRIPTPYTANWISKIILSNPKKEIMTITLHPDYPDPIVLNNYYNGIMGYRGKVKKIRTEGIEVVPDNLTGEPGIRGLLILRQNGNYLFAFDKLNFQIGDKIEASVTIVQEEWSYVIAEWITMDEIW